MKKTAAFHFLNILTLFLLSLAGCGGNESPISSPTSSTVPFSGVVEDGPIVGAKVSLRDKDGTYYPLYNSQGHYEYLVITDGDGLFSREVNAGTDFSNLTVRAVGGIDRDTGMGFKELEMRSPLGLFNGGVSAIVVSPLTTLVAELHDQGFSFTEAEKLLGDWLFPFADVDLAAAPHTNLDLQRCTLLLSKIALESTKENPFALISKQIFIAETVVDVSVMEELGIVDTETQIQIRKLQSSLAAATTIDEMFTNYKREELRNIFEVNFKERLELSTPFDAQQNFNYQQNVEVLVEKILIAAGDEVILLVDPIPNRLFRYLSFTYNLTTTERLTLDPTAFSAALSYSENDTKVVLESDPWIAMLAGSSSTNSVNSPLLSNELPGDDNQKRVDYFYGSELSPHFRAEQLIKKIFDDDISDAVFLKILEGKANAGLVDEARTIIATQIIQPEPQANAYRALANTWIRFNKYGEALHDLDLARDLYRDVMVAHNGATLTISTDVANLLATAASYRRAGDLLNAQSLLKDVANIATSLSTNSALIFGNLITGVKDLVDAYIVAGELESAVLLVEKMDSYSDLTPAYLGTYKLRVFNWSETAKRYADLGMGVNVLQVYDKIKALRATDAATATATWVYVPSLIDSLYRVGATTQALELANTIPSGSTYLGAAFKLVATYEALQGNLDIAFSIVDNVSYVPKAEDKVDLLTYFTGKRPYIAMTLITAGRFSEARRALEKAEGLLETMTQSNNLVRISNGYVKVAELYALMGDHTKAAALLERAQILIADDVYRITALADIALGYQNFNQSDAALALLDSALNLANIDPTQYRANPALNLGVEEYATQLYEKLIKSYEQVGDRDGVHTATFAFQSWAKKIHTAGTVDDKLAIKECIYLLRAVLYLERAGYHVEALNTLNSAKALTVGRLENNVTVYDIVVAKDRMENCLNVITTYALIHEYEQGLNLALSLPFTTERNQAIKTLAIAHIKRDDFPESLVASIDSDGDGHPDFFHPLASSAEIFASGLILDDDSDGDGIKDLYDIRPLFVD